MAAQHDSASDGIAASSGTRCRQLDVLILHDNSNPSNVRRTSFNHAFCLLKYAPWNRYEIQSFRQLVPRFIRQKRFDLIVLDTTFLCWRWSYPREENFERLLREYSFVVDSDAVKIALPQDEYDHSVLLDDWLSEWRVDVIYSVCYEHREALYPRAMKSAEIIEGMTGYIDDADVTLMARLARPFELREIDVGYRAKALPAYFGKFGQLKSEIGVLFRKAYADAGLRLDISVDPKDTFLGDEWLRFLGNCRFTLGCESGSSLLDPVGDIATACKLYLGQHPTAGFEEVEAACFAGHDMKKIYSAISPRIFEAALAGVCQILVPANYLGILQPNEHYIPWYGSDAQEGTLLAELADWSKAKERISACRAALLGNERLSYRGFVKDMLHRAEVVLQQRVGATARMVAATQPAVDTIEKMHASVEAVVRASINRSEGDIEEPDRIVDSGRPRICLLALSAIVDDPRVRRQGDLFAANEWSVVAAGVPGGRSPAPEWRIMDGSGTSMKAEGIAAPEPDSTDVASLTGAAHAAFVRWRKGILRYLDGWPHAQRGIVSVWRAVRFCALVPVWTYWSIRSVVRRLTNDTISTIRALKWRLGLADLREGVGVARHWRLGRLWRSVRYRGRMARVRIDANLAEQILWKELAISSRLDCVYNAAKKGKADIWLANDWNMLPVAARLARERGGIYVYDTHELAVEEYAEKWRWRLFDKPLVCAIERKFISDAAVVSTVSPGIGERLNRRYRLRRPTLIVRNTPLYQSCTFRRTGERVQVLYHGIIAPGRGLEEAIDSVAIWRPEFELTIRGPENPGYSDALRQRIRDAGAEGRAQLVPPVPMIELIKEANAFDIGFFALPGHSRHNEFALPNKFFEYAMAGLALCVSDLPEMSRLVKQYQLGVLIPNLDPASIGAVINGLDRERIDLYKQNALAAARELCWERESERMVAAYEALLPARATA